MPCIQIWGCLEFQTLLFGGTLFLERGKVGEKKMVLLPLEKLTLAAV